MREFVVIGAGIVGVSIARELSARTGIRVTVLERNGDNPKGSTVFAPGFVGLYNDAPVLTELAKASASIYAAAGTGFVRSGGLELATSEAGALEITRRSQAACAAGLSSTVLSPGELPESVTAFVDLEQVVAAAHCADDGVAECTGLLAGLRTQAESRGARFISGRVIAVDPSDGGYSVSIATGERFVADDVILAGGIWGTFLADLVGLTLPLFPVAHPYVYSAEDTGLEAGPFVRWPERHVYARVHGNRLGIGSYDHAPVSVGPNELNAGAGLPWDEAFSPVVASAQRLFCSGARFEPQHRINGVFSMTPDNLPFLGAHPAMPGVWLAQAIWITHAAGAAATLAEAVIGNGELPQELRIDRFSGQSEGKLRDTALRLYRDIYANERT